MRHLKLSAFTVCGCFAFICLTACLPTQAAPLVNFTLSLDASRPGAQYQNFRSAGAGTKSNYTIGFQVTVNSVDGVPLGLGPLASFCSELAEPIGASTYTFEAKHLEHVAAGQAGVPASASSNIPSDGIGLLRAARVKYLFDRHYISSALSEWEHSTTNPITHAFQLAVWELTHDDDLSLTSSAGQIYLGAQSGSGSTLRNNAIALAIVPQRNCGSRC